MLLLICQKKRKRCSDFEPWCDPFDHVPKRSTCVLNSDVNIIDQDEHSQFDTHPVNDVQAQHYMDDCHTDDSGFFYNFD